MRIEFSCVEHDRLPSTLMQLYYLNYCLTEDRLLSCDDTCILTTAVTLIHVLHLCLDYIQQWLATTSVSSWWPSFMWRRNRMQLLPLLMDDCFFQLSWQRNKMSWQNLLRQQQQISSHSVSTETTLLSRDVHDCDRNSLAAVLHDCLAIPVGILYVDIHDGEWIVSVLLFMPMAWWRKRQQWDRVDVSTFFYTNLFTYFYAISSTNSCMINSILVRRRNVRDNLFVTLREY